MTSIVLVTVIFGSIDAMTIVNASDGIARKTSTMRISTSLTAPPLYPAIRPTAVPIRLVSTPARIPTSSVTRAP